MAIRKEIEGKTDHSVGLKPDLHFVATPFSVRSPDEIQCNLGNCLFIFKPEMTG